MSTQLILSPPPSLTGIMDRPPAMFLPDDRTAERFFEFFAANEVIEW
jgi:hypothetical protein